MDNELQRSTSADAILLMLIKLATTVLAFVVTRLLSESLSLYDYGVYSQILLIVSTISTLTILGMIDGVNYFYCSVPDEETRESYIATIFLLQTVISTFVGIIVLLLTKPLCTYFGNPSVGRLMFFAAVLPFFQNLLGMSQVLLVSVGKARMLAVRNLIVSLVRLAAVIVVTAVIQDIAILFTAILILDIAQFVFFAIILKNNHCPIRLKRADYRKIKNILQYCAPMAVYIIIGSLNRDMDKYLIALMTDTETLAVYTNASKALPFDIILTSFCTVLVPKITRLVSEKDYVRAVPLYRSFLQIGYVTTGVLCCAALAAAPQLMELLYSEKYIEGLNVFRVYILVDLLRFTNITMILSAAGKTRKLMLLGLGSFGLNAALNIIFYHFMGIVGPAVATLVTTLLVGVLMLWFGAKELHAKFTGIFDVKYLLIFLAESFAGTILLHRLQNGLQSLGVHYFVVLLVVSAIYCGVMLLLQGKRLVAALKSIDEV